MLPGRQQRRLEECPPLGSHRCLASRQTWQKVLSWLLLRAGIQHPGLLLGKLCHGRRCTHSSPPALHPLPQLADVPVRKHTLESRRLLWINQANMPMGKHEGVLDTMCCKRCVTTYAGRLKLGSTATWPSFDAAAATCCLIAHLQRLQPINLTP